MSFPMRAGTASLAGERRGRKTAFGFKNGMPVVAGTGQSAEISEAEIEELANKTARLTYRSRGADESKAAAIADAAATGSVPGGATYVPAHIAYDKKVLMFNAFFKQTVHESADENYRVRVVKIFYFLEDDTMAVHEPPVANSGLAQGKFIKRQMLPKDGLGNTFTWKDLNVGANVTFYGRTFHIYDSDKWTRTFLEKEGIEVGMPEEPPTDQYQKVRKVVDQPGIPRAAPESFDSFAQFLVLDRKVLKFNCVWDDPSDGMGGELRPFIIHYFLVDDTVEVREVHTPNDGRDQCAVLLRRQRVARNPKDMPADFPSSVLEPSSDEVGDYLNPADFAIGQDVWIFGRQFVICDMDEFTKEFYRRNFNVHDFEALDAEMVKATKLAPAPVAAPPSFVGGFGSPEDSLQSCLSLQPKPPKRDFVKLLEFDNKALRYSARLDVDTEPDKSRKFIISYGLANDKITIYEPPQRNSGVSGGKFLEATKVVKPNSDPTNPEYYTAKDLHVGEAIVVFKRKFVLVDADDFVKQLMEQQPQLFQ